MKMIGSEQPFVVRFKAFIADFLQSEQVLCFWQ